MTISTNVILLGIIIYFILDKLLFSERGKKEDTTSLVQLQILEMMKNQSAINSNVTFEETKSIMNTMVDEYLENMYSSENEKLHLIKDKDFPTSWEDVYTYPNISLQQDQIRRLKQSIRVNSSETFMNRIRIFYSDTYINEYLDKVVEEKYYQRLITSEENAKLFRNKCRENLEKIRAEEDAKRKKEIIEKNDRLNNLISTFSHSKYLPTDMERVDDKEYLDKIDTHKLLRGRYVCNRKYYDSISRSLNDEEDVVNKAQQYEKVDDTLIAYLSKEFEWDKMQDTPLITENAKFDIAEISLRYKLNPVAENLFGEHTSPSSYKQEYKGKTYDLTGKRLNNIFHLSETYEKNYMNIEEASITEAISSILI